MLDLLLRDTTAVAADRPLVITGAGVLTYGAALDRAGELALGLRDRGVERFACLIHDPRHLVPLLIAASALGAEPCVYRPESDDETVASLAARFGHTTVVTDRSELPVLEGTMFLRVEACAVRGGALPQRSSSTPAPVLVLTTGTTGDPKGARHDWSRLASGVKPSPSDGVRRWLLTYNVNQFAGLQVVLHVLVYGDTLVVPESNQPRRALDAMHEHAVTHVSATPTFWRFLVALLDDPDAAPPRLQQITLGGEASTAQLLADLERLFPDARISQVYAATEAGSTVSVRDRRNGLPASVLDRGSDDEVRFRIVDGQLEISSRVGMLGYYGEDDTVDQWRTTGDLVEVRGDRIYFIGRTNEVINVGGVKVHPLPVEEVIASVDGVELVHVRGRSNPVAGSIVVADVVPRAGTDEDELESRIREACMALPEAARPRRIRFVDELEVRDTKVVRSG